VFSRCGGFVLELERYLLEPLPTPISRSPEPDDHLLYPEKRGLTSDRSVLAACPKKQCSGSTLHRWGYGILENAGLVPTQ
jgi:hypothetical protein